MSCPHRWLAKIPALPRLGALDNLGDWESLQPKLKAGDSFPRAGVPAWRAARSVRSRVSAWPRPSAPIIGHALSPTAALSTAPRVGF